MFILKCANSIDVVNVVRCIDHGIELKLLGFFSENACGNLLCFNLRVCHGNIKTDHSWCDLCGNSHEF